MDDGKEDMIKDWLLFEGMGYVCVFFLDTRWKSKIEQHYLTSLTKKHPLASAINAKLISFGARSRMET